MLRSAAVLIVLVLLKKMHVTFDALCVSSVCICFHLLLNTLQTIVSGCRDTCQQALMLELLQEQCRALSAALVACLATG